MLTKRFWDTARNINYTVWNPFHQGDIDWGETYADLIDASTHCGTAEIRGIEEDTEQSGSPQTVAALICKGVRDEIGHFLYYCPKDSDYKHAIKLLRQVGFKKVCEFTHYGYTDRKPDYGRAQMWQLSLTKAEFDALRNGVHNGTID